MKYLHKFLKNESATGILLLAATALALIFANTGLAGIYNLLLSTPFEIRLGDWSLGKPLLLWINDGLMAIFFFLVGLELKREMVAGELSNPRKIILPIFAAIGGMAVPALIYFFVNRDNPVALQGWAIPSATDIAFALGVLAMLGSRVPLALKIFLTSVAVMDDLGAIVVIAVFYTDSISLSSLVIAFVVLIGLFILNRRGEQKAGPYLLLGLILWVAVLKSGVHATLAGVALAMFIPTRKDKPELSPLYKLEHGLHPWVSFMILPIFAFANAGVTLSGLTAASFLDPIPLGIALGLFFGNQIGIPAMAYLAVKLKIAELPSGLGWRHIYGAALLCGIGFTMSLFIGSLAFESTGGDDVSILVDERVGIICGSLLSGVIGSLYLRWVLKRDAEKELLASETAS